MNSIFKLITNQQIPETANALVPVIGYEPWSLRALESIKSSIVNGVPTLIRVHSAADYPIENRPHIILFDEITSSLDSNSTKVFYEMLNTRLSSSTVLFVSHDDVVDSAFDRVLEIDELHAL